ncbi:MAG TPA: copper-containing nitrite reductase [Verrucomicrobiae bacterium]|nr:copper-containing nitrite reductase [Verrucomicrobiae bacterium]
MKSRTFALAVIGLIALTQIVVATELREQARLTYAPAAPPPITRRHPAIVEVHLEAGRKLMPLGGGAKYEFWTFNGHTPGPFIRARVGDTLEIHITNSDTNGMPHNCDLHAVTGPGGGAPVLTVVKGEEHTAWFKLLHPGLFVYHCAAPPVMDHIANGMYGLVLVEPVHGLPKVDHEYYVMQSEFYTKDAPEDAEVLQYSHEKGLLEHPTFVVFNGRVGSLTGKGVLKAKTGEKVRIYFGNIGPNFISSFHVIGTIFDKVYRDGGLVDPPAHSIQTTLVPAGGATVVELEPEVPGTYTLVDHAIFRVEQGAVGYLNVEGSPSPDVYGSDKEAVKCPGCLVHP